MEREEPRHQGSDRQGWQRHVRVQHREKLRAGEKPQGPSDALDRRDRQQRAPGEHDAARGRAHQGEQTLRHDRDSRRAPRLRRSRGVLQLDPVRLLLPPPAGTGGGQRRHRRAESGKGAGWGQEGTVTLSSCR